MFNVNNELIEIKVYQKGKLVRKEMLKNRLTNLYLDYVLYRTLKQQGVDTSFSDNLFPEFDDVNDPELLLFSTAYVSYDVEALNDDSTSMNYDLISAYGGSNVIADVKTFENSKTMELSFGFGTINPPAGSFFKTIGFGRYEPFVTNNWLFSFIDVSALNVAVESDTQFVISRFDRITSNAMGTSGEYFPFLQSGDDGRGALNQIKVCYDKEGNCLERVYDLDDLTFTRQGAGVIEITGFDRFYNSDGLYPSDTLFAGHDKILDIGYDVLVETKNGYLYTLRSLNLANIDFQVGKRYRALQNGKDIFFKVVEVNYDLNFAIINADGYQLETQATGTNMFVDSQIEFNTFPQEPGKPERVVFIYNLNRSTITDYIKQEVYVDMKDLGVEYNDTEFKIRINIERGGF